MNKKWEFYETDEKAVEQVKNEFGLSTLLATIIVNKGL